MSKFFSFSIAGLLAVSSFLSTQAWAQGAAAFYVPNAVEADLSQAGLNLAVGDLRRTMLAEELTGPLDDAYDRQYGVDIEATGMTYRVKVNDVSLQARADGLKLNIVMDHAIAYADRIAFKKKIGTTLKSTCKDTEVRIGDSGTISMSVMLDARVDADGHIVLSERDFSLPVPEDQFTVKGPRTCSGDLGVGSLIKYAVKKILINARKRVEGALSDRLNHLMPTFAQSLDEQLHKTFPFEWSIFPTIPAKQLALTTRPTSVQIAEDKFRVVMGAGIEEIGLREFQEILAEQKSAKDDQGSIVWEALKSERFGTVGLNPALANEIFAALTPTQPEFFELSSDVIPQIGEILNRGSLATIWPDLNAIDLSEQRIRAFISMPRAPRMEFERTSGVVTLALKIDDFHLTFAVNRGGEWQRYAHLHIGINAPIQVGIVDRVLKVGAGLAAVAIDGSFDAGYTPVVPIFERDMALVVIRTLFDVLAQQGMIAVVDVPNIPLGGESVTIDGFRVTEPFLQMDLVRATR